MQIVLAMLLVPYYIGAFVSIMVYPIRAGGSPFGAYVTAVMHPPSRRNGIPWLIKTLVKVIGWPFVLWFWNRDGRPASPVLFGESAAEKLGMNPAHSQGFRTKWTA